jgi:hypothetical protein
VSDPGIRAAALAVDLLLIIALIIWRGARDPSKADEDTVTGASTKLRTAVFKIPKEGWALIVSVAVALSYAVIYLIYFQFYVSFGLRPSDVGLSRTRLLEESIIGIVLTPVRVLRSEWVLVVTVAIAAIIVRTLITLRRTSSDENRFGGRTSSRELRSTFVAAFVIMICVLTVTGTIGLARDLRRLGNDVRKDGHIVVATVRSRGPADIYSPVFDVQAIPVDVSPKKDADMPQMTARCLFYLGESSGEAIIFDVRRELVVRLPTSDYVFTTHPAVVDYEDGRLPAGCASNEGNKADQSDPG